MKWIRCALGECTKRFLKNSDKDIEYYKWSIYEWQAHYGTCIFATNIQRLDVY